MDKHSPAVSASARPRWPLPTRRPACAPAWPAVQDHDSGSPIGRGRGGCSGAAVVPSGSFRTLPGPAAGRFLSTGFLSQRPSFQSGHWAWAFLKEPCSGFRLFPDTVQRSSPGHRPPGRRTRWASH